MKRPTSRRLEQEMAQKNIVSAKSNKPFMAALLDRDHRGHREAVDQWSRLHEAAFTDDRREIGPETESRGAKHRPKKSASAVSGRSSGRFALADSGIDDWEADQARDAARRRSEPVANSTRPPPITGQQPMPGSSGSSGFWVVDQSGRDFVLINPITDSPVVDEDGQRVSAPPEAFDQAVPAPVEPFQRKLFEIWRIDEEWVGAKSGVVYGIMLDMLRARQMDRSERARLWQRISELPEQLGPGWGQMQGALRARLSRAFREPFWYPAIMTDAELEAHRSTSRTVESIAEVGRLTGSGAGPAGRNQTTILGKIGRAVPFVLATGASTIVDEHYESRAEAYEAEIRRRRGPNIWPPAPHSP